MVSYKKHLFSQLIPLAGFVYIAHIYNMKDTKQKKDFIEGMKHYKTLI